MKQMQSFFDSFASSAENIDPNTKDMFPDMPQPNADEIVSGALQATIDALRLEDTVNKNGIADKLESFRSFSKQLLSENAVAETPVAASASTQEQSAEPRTTAEPEPVQTSEPPQEQPLLEDADSKLMDITETETPESARNAMQSDVDAALAGTPESRLNVFKKYMFLNDPAMRSLLASVLDDPAANDRQTAEARKLLDLTAPDQETLNFSTDSSSKRPYYAIPFPDGLKDAVDPAKKDEYNPVFVSETPKVFREIGFPALPMMMNRRHLRLNYYSPDEFKNLFGPMHFGEHAHGLHGSIERIVNALKNPLAVVVNKRPNAKPGSIVAITDIDIDGRKFVAPVLIDTASAADGQRIDAHLILTIYDSSDWVNQFLIPAIEAEKNGIGIFYFDEEKAGRYRTLSNRKGRIPTGFVHTIDDVGSPVKGFFKKITETLQFRRWFKDSKVVDDEGKPLVVYHGTDADFNVFNMDKSRANMDIRGAFFSPWEDDARGYGKNVRSFYLSLQNPADEDTAYRALRMFQGQNNAGVKAREFLIRQGYDGVNFGNQEYIAFYPNQIKSETDNIGTFDPENNDIRFSVPVPGGDLFTWANENPQEDTRTSFTTQMVQGTLGLFGNTTRTESAETEIPQDSFFPVVREQYALDFYRDLNRLLNSAQNADPEQRGDTAEKTTAAKQTEMRAAKQKKTYSRSSEQDTFAAEEKI